jgi:hypothetical protein
VSETFDLGTPIGHNFVFPLSHGAGLSVYDEAGNVIETHEEAGEFKEP